MIYTITPQGVITVLHTFGDGSVAHDGGQPLDGVVQAKDGNFYGTTNSGGTSGAGCVFKITPSGALTILHNFDDGSVMNDGSFPFAGVIQGSDGNFYGVTPDGGTGFRGTVFKMTPAGVVTILHNFQDGSVANDGAGPDYALVEGNDGNFYGTTAAGGTTDNGTAFQITPQGVLTILHNFAESGPSSNGAEPKASLVQSAAGNFYGVTFSGGSAGSGTIYSFIPTEAPTSVPVFTGSAYALSGLFTPFTFTPKASFGVSGSGNTDNLVTPSASGSFLDAIVSLFTAPVHKNFTQTNWTLTPLSALPNDLTFDSTSGTISGTPIQAGTFTFTMTPNNAIGPGTPQTVTLYIDVPPGIDSGRTLTASTGTPFTYQIATTPPADSYGGTLLPSWLAADPVTGIISGTPPAAGSYLFNAVAENVSGQSVQTVTLNVTGGGSSTPAITSASTANGTVGDAFTYQIATTPAATSYSALSLPIGLIFDAPTGTISGVPTVPGTFTVPLSAANGSGSYSAVLSLTIAAPPVPGIASSLVATAAVNAPYTYQIPASGVVSSYAATGLPTGLMLDPTSGIISGTPTALGSSQIMITVTNPVGSSDSELTLNVASAIDFTDWATAHGATGGLTGDPKSDGVPNLLKYLYDLNPASTISAPDHAALPVVGDTTIGNVSYLTITYRDYALATGLGVTLYTSSDLKTWTAVNPPDLSRQIGNDPVTGDPIMQLGVIATGHKQFIRLNVSAP